MPISRLPEIIVETKEDIIASNLIGKPNSLHIGHNAGASESLLCTQINASITRQSFQHALDDTSSVHFNVIYYTISFFLRGDSF